MKNIWILLACGLLGLALLGGCYANTPTPPLPTATPTVTPTVFVPPTPSIPGDPISWQDLRVSMDMAEINESFTTRFGSQRLPSPGEKFLWVHIIIQNLGASEADLPDPANFSVLHADTELKPTYGHRQGYADYTALDATLFPGLSVDAWLRFDIPDTAELRDLRFVFLPESVQVGVRPVAPTYPWGGEHPIFVWEFKP